jgi:cobalt-zinc-cadmium efflux system outer membrane protein
MSVAPSAHAARQCRARDLGACLVGGAAAFAFACVGAAAPSLAFDGAFGSPVPRLAMSGEPASALPGATVDDLVAIAARMNPDVAAAALETHAALARVDAAGRLPDPMFRTEFKDIDRNQNNALPDDLGRVEYRLEQTVPLWGKLGLREQVARAQAGVARQSQRAVDLEVATRIKTVFARYYAAFESARLTEDLYRTVATLADVTQSRYAQGFGEQEDAIRAQVEKTRLRSELVRFEAEQRQTAAQLNALMDRRAGAPLAEPVGLRPIPEQILALPELVERGEVDNPAVSAAEARVRAAEGEKSLVGKTWYPDVTLGAAVQQFVEQDRRTPGYEAMIGFEIPLQWGLREAWEREASANLVASRRRRDAEAASLRSELADAYWALIGAREVGSFLDDVQLPQARLALQAALRGYEQGRSNMNAVLDTEERVLETMLRLLDIRVEQQSRLAEIERLIGRDL